MTRYRFRVAVPPNIVASSSWGHFLYAALLEQLPSEVAELCHRPEMTPLCQHFLPGQVGQPASWTVTLLTGEAEQAFSPLLEHCAQLPIRALSCLLTLQLTGREFIPSPEAFLDRAAALRDRPAAGLQLVTPTAFKSGGSYQILPSVHQILQNLAKRWTLTAPSYPISDPDALAMMEERIWIRDYRLQSQRYDLKGQRIPGFTGTLWLQHRLPAPLLELWKALLLFSDFGGLGIKTALGMGGVVLL